MPDHRGIGNRLQESIQTGKTDFVVQPIHTSAGTGTVKQHRKIEISALSEKTDHPRIIYGDIGSDFSDSYTTQLPETGEDPGEIGLRRILDLVRLEISEATHPGVEISKRNDPILILLGRFQLADDIHLGLKEERSLHAFRRYPRRQHHRFVDSF